MLVWGNLLVQGNYFGLIFIRYVDGVILGSESSALSEISGFETQTWRPMLTRSSTLNPSDS